MSRDKETQLSNQILLITILFLVISPLVLYVGFYVLMGFLDFTTNLINRHPSMSILCLFLTLATVVLLALSMERIVEGISDLVSRFPKPNFAKLVNRGDVKTLIKCLGNDRYYREALSALATIGPSAVDDLVEALRSEKREIPGRAEEALLKIAKESGSEGGIKSLVAALEDEFYSLSVRKSIVRILGEVDHPLTKDALVAASKVRDLKRLAIEALGKKKDPSLFETFCRALQSSSYEIRMSAAEALGEFKTKRAFKPLAKALNDEEPAVAIAACEALGKIRDPRALSKLEDLLSASDELQSAAAHALANFCEGDPPVSRAQDILRKALAHENPRVQTTAHRALGGVGFPDPVLKCWGCGRKYQLGVDAAVITDEGIAGSFAIRVGSPPTGGTQDSPDRVASPLRKDADITKHLEVVRRARSQGLPRLWRCEHCKTVNPYPWNKSQTGSIDFWRPYV